MKKKNLLMTTLAALSASGALLTTGASALAASHTVSKNDTLWALSRKYGVSVSALKKANGISGSTIYVGQKLQIPSKSSKTASSSASASSTSATTHTVVKGDTLWAIAKKYGVSVSALMKANNLSSTTILIGQSLKLQTSLTSYGTSGVTTSSSKTASSTPSTSSSASKTASSTSSTSSSASKTASSTSSTSSSASKTASSTSSTSTSSSTPAVSQAPTGSKSTASTASSSTSSTSSSSSSTSTSSASASAITAYALTFLGVPYVWGGSTPSGFDCSGLVQYVYAHFGINLGRTTYTQQYAGTKISVASAQAGDLYFWGSYGSAYHVAIALGGGQYVMAPAPGQNVMVGSVSSYTPSFAVRVLS
ncbi:hypothetical protein lacNasYZ03_12370 [Lactobacillus nasalidis]|uniref:LysM peptidoglycan-binding domain-containing protein n=1 Tax=Lactobacillus nasalidis TaxID=2797258 RepID=A0ABQ3W4U2_9LACO|nr:C40 family peptidase [Lactobacillus nasalidis]GHV97599.1 hypothetical protein lacNasYZ01_07810 [Lactobacillus nasalidis]GHV99359.1 hypothetical protein lacNasYZ02_07890 [Lactobacillus nasalidis]GHW01550.1 hypothetical protein lacNasYZ03_12370 [Lactobacillus nasalidis]